MGESQPETPSPVGRMIVFALARSEGLSHTEAMRVVEYIVKPRAPIPSLEQVLNAIGRVERREPLLD